MMEILSRSRLKIAAHWMVRLTNLPSKACQPAHRLVTTCKLQPPTSTTQPTTHPTIQTTSSPCHAIQGDHLPGSAHRELVFADARHVHSRCSIPGHWAHVGRVPVQPIRGKGFVAWLVEGVAWLIAMVNHQNACSFQNGRSTRRSSNNPSDD